MHAYLARVFSEHDSPAIEAGGTEDHVHILGLLSRNHAISEIIKKAKVSSSGWIKTQGGLLSRFEWQGGLAIVSTVVLN
jgi:putative transposase